MVVPVVCGEGETGAHAVSFETNEKVRCVRGEVVRDIGEFMLFRLCHNAARKSTRFFKLFAGPRARSDAPCVVVRICPGDVL